MRQTVVLAVMTVLMFFGCSAVAYDRGLHIEVSPSVPTESEPVTIEAWAWFNIYSQELASASYTRDGYQIDMDVVMRALYSPFPVSLPVQDGGSINCGPLPVGAYHVTAEMWMIPIGHEDPWPTPILSGNASFAVVPEPTAFVLLAIPLGGILIFARRRHA